MILLLVLIGLTSCTTTKLPTERADYNSLLIDMIPELPSIPNLPELTWSLENDKYCLSETDVDKLLDYGENELPLYKFEMDSFNKQLELILNGITNK